VFLIDIFNRLIVRITSNGTREFMIRENTGQNEVPHCFLLFGHFVVVKILDWIKNATKNFPTFI